jgi:F-type H+-transporting ATPase subunit delta
MKETIIAKVYAKSLLDLGKENNVKISDEFTSLTETINASNDLENVLFLDVFTNDEKISVFKAIANKLNLSEISIAAVEYLITEKRIGILPLIFKEMIVLEDFEKGFLRGTIEGNTESISDDYKNKLVQSIQKYIGNKTAVLTYKQNNKISAGYKLTLDDLQLDATLDNQLKFFKESILSE